MSDRFCIRDLGPVPYDMSLAAQEALRNRREFAETNRRGDADVAAFEAQLRDESENDENFDPGCAIAAAIGVLWFTLLAIGVGWLLAQPVAVQADLADGLGRWCAVGLTVVAMVAVAVWAAKRMGVRR